jgi:hypothetical protein
MKSCTSRPRSPTKAATTTSTLAWRLNIDSKLLLPQPAGAKMPTRWPKPQVSAASIAFTPTDSTVSMGLRAKGDGAGCTTVRFSLVAGKAGPRSKKREPMPSTTRPKRKSPTATVWRWPVAMTCVLADKPSSAPIGLINTVSPSKPMTSALSSRPLRVSSRRQSSPTSARKPLARINVPTACCSLPRSITTVPMRPATSPNKPSSS